MTSITFDTLASAKRLKAKGVKSEDAEAFAEELKAANEIDFSHLATKEEMNLFKSEMKGDFDIIRRDMQLLESRITNKMGAMMIALAGFLVTIRFFGH